MYSESEYGCTDSIFFDINIEPSVIEFPNVFTPNDDLVLHAHHLGAQIGEYLISFLLGVGIQYQHQQYHRPEPTEHNVEECQLGC